MNIYLTTQDGKRTRIPLVPDKISVRSGAKMQTISTIQTGDIQLPKGTQVDQLTWNGVFPGQARQSMPFVFDWQPPVDLVKTLKGWESNGDKLRLLVTNSSINLDVFLSSFQHEYSGGFGDVTYTITLIEARQFVVYSDSEWNSGKPTQAKTASVATSRANPPSPKTYTVKPGDTLWAIAKRTLHDGSRYTDIYTANKSTIGPDPSVIIPGQQLKIPA